VIMNRAERTEERTPLDSAIERYVAGDMSLQERTAFETRLLNDPEAQELLEAERLVQRYATRTSISTVFSSAALPNAAILAHLANTRPAKRWVANGAMGMYAVGLAVLLYLLYSSPAEKVPPVQPAAVPVASPMLQSAPKPNVSSTIEQPLLNPPIVGAVRTTDSAEKKPVDQDLLEPVGTPKVYDKDSVRVKIRSN